MIEEDSITMDEAIMTNKLGLGRFKNHKIMSQVVSEGNEDDEESIDIGGHDINNQ